MASNGRIRAEKRSHATTLTPAPSASSSHAIGANKQARLSRAHQSVNTRSALTDISNKAQPPQNHSTNQHKRADPSHAHKESAHVDAAIKPVTRSQSRTNGKENTLSRHAQPTANHLQPQPAKPTRRSSRSAVSSSSSSTSSGLQQSYSLSNSALSEGDDYNDDSRLDDSYAPPSNDSAADEQNDEEDERADGALNGAAHKLRADAASRVLTSPSAPEPKLNLSLSSSSSSSSYRSHIHLPRSRLLHTSEKAQDVGSLSSASSLKPASSAEYARRVYEPVKPSASEQSSAVQRWSSATAFKADYSSSIFHHLLTAERHSLPSPTYMDDVQGDLSYPMRAILLDWLVEVAEEYHLQPQTLWLCMSYVDRFLAVQPVDRARLQLVGVSCMLVAAKYWEIYPPTIDDFVYISDHTYDRQQVLSTERSVLQTLRFQLTVPTAWEFGRRLHALCRMSEVEGHLMEFVMEAFMQEKDILDWAPSVTAVAAAYLALSTVGRRTGVAATLCEASGYEYRDVKECVRAMWALHTRMWLDANDVIAGGTQGLKAVKDKYSGSKWSEVSNIRPRSSIAEIK